MLLSSKPVVCVLLTLLFITTGCSINEPRQNNEEPVLSGNEGTVSLSIPSIKYFLKMTGNKKNDSRAILSSEDVRIKVFKNGEVYEEPNWKPNKETNIYDYLYYNRSVDIKLKPGTYTMEIEVYNPHNKIKPVVTGKSEEFEVISNKTIDVGIVAIPVEPEIINMGDELNLKKSDYIATKIDEYEKVTAGSEKWYSFTPTTEYTNIDIKPDIDDVSLLVLIYDSEGNFYDVVRDRILPTTPNETYYIGTAYIDFTKEFYDLPYSKDLTSKSIKISPFEDKEDNNDSLETAEVLTVGEPKFLSIDKKEDTDFFKVELKSGGKYRLEFNFFNNVVVKAVYNSSGEVIHNFTDDSGLIYNSFNYTPEQDETIYISVTMKPESFYIYDNSKTYVHIFNMLESTVYLEFGGYYRIEEGDNIEVIVIDNLTEERTEFNSPLKREDGIADIELNGYKLKDNVSIECLMKDRNGEVKYASNKIDLRDKLTPRLYPSLYSTKIDIELSGSSLLTGKNGIEKTIEFYDSEHSWGHSNWDLTMKATIIEAPENSQLLNKEFKLEDGLYDTYYSFDITTDLPGKYKFNVEATNGYTTDTQEYTLYTTEENEGALYVTFK